MEDLLTLFDKVQQTSNLPVLAQEFVLVQNPGMQHWLNMEQANISGIAMNAAFVLPAQFLWKQLKLLSGEIESDQAPYSREVLAWRIDAILQTDDVLQNPDCAVANNYWSQGEAKDALKRFQLAVQLADLYEQYLIYRPQWVNAWADGQQHSDLNGIVFADAKWQGHIWSLLQRDIAYNPMHLFELAKAKVDDNKHLLPKRISIFGINALAPMWVDFLALLGEVTDVHFYHLNPCYEYWADVQTDKAIAKQAYLAQIEKWPEDAIKETRVNPILANLGQQGREFLGLLHQTDNIEIPIFDELFLDHHLMEKATDTKTLGQDQIEQEHTSPSVLLQLQKDILTLTDRRENPSKSVDDSITITSAHSALREVQGLHDYLLHLFNDDSELTPKDVLVMCPQIEQYAPYIDSVFVRGWDDIGENIPPLPCSIADRVSKDSEPLVAAFSELLSLPDSRFGVSQILSYLRLLPLQLRFDLNEADVELISDWLEKANVHWGLDEQHKNSILAIDSASHQYTWQQGLSRLLLGFAYSDNTELFQDDMVLPWVEGSNGIVLGKLLQLCEQLVAMTHDLGSAKSAKDWQKLLTHYLDSLFVEQDFDQGYAIILHAIDALVEFCEQADYTADIELSIIRDFLNSHFSQPDPGRQFMIGQITFCSMLPMRSIPFKVIAVLGLNDGDYPRQRQPLGFDLMAMTPAKVGDRSRRGDDRYLFLEALISARKNLYLSYQGNDIKNNNERQPSLVLRELMDYLHTGYLWQFNAGEQLRQLPLQVFSIDNFRQSNPYQSFDQKWFNLANNQHNESQDIESIVLPAPQEPVTQISIVELHAFINHPSKVFAQNRLKLFFRQTQQMLDDSEPFAVDFLNKYLYQQDILQTQTQTQTQEPIESDAHSTTAAQSHVVTELAKRSGQFPDTPLLDDYLSDWEQGMHRFAHSINQKLMALLPEELTQSITEPETAHVQCQIESEALSVTIAGEIQQLSHENHRYQWQFRPASMKAKDLTLLYLNHLLACAASEGDTIRTFGFFINEKKQQLQTVQFEHITHSLDHLERLGKLYLQGMNQPLLLNAQIGHAHFWQKDQYVDADINAQSFKGLWQGNQHVPGLVDDPYMNYFWSEQPDIEPFIDMIKATYQPMYQALNFRSDALFEPGTLPLGGMPNE